MGERRSTRDAPGLAVANVVAVLFLSWCVSGIERFCCGFAVPPRPEKRGVRLALLRGGFLLIAVVAHHSFLHDASMLHRAATSKLD